MPCSVLIFGLGEKNDLSATKDLARVVENDKGGRGPADENGQAIGSRPLVYFHNLKRHNEYSDPHGLVRDAFSAVISHMCAYLEVNKIYPDDP